VGSAPGGSPASYISGSAPGEGLALDPRKEANKVRMSFFCLDCCCLCAHSQPPNHVWLTCSGQQLVHD
jgi:hypothetical protein